MFSSPEPFVSPIVRAVSTPAALYADADERSRHVSNIEQLALETDCPVQIIEPIYEQLLARLKSGATVQDYLTILVAKGVKNALKQIARAH